MEQRTVASNEHTQNIRAGISVLKTNYGLTIDEYDYLDIAVDVLRDIRYMGCTDYLAFKKVDSSGSVDIPCNLDEINAITTAQMAKEVFGSRSIYEDGSEDMYSKDDYLKKKSIASAVGFGSVPGNDVAGSAGYISYSIDTTHKKIYVGNKYAGQSIGIAYIGTSTDLEGFPLITRKQANAIAAVCAKVVCMRGANRGDKNMAQLIELYVGISARLVQAAAMPESISDNDIDEILNCKTSFNRKSINRPTKYGR